MKPGDKTRILRNRQAGFTLLEALLTLFVLTIGVLGVAGLQMQSIRSGGLALQRTAVVIKTQELIERMRANRYKMSPNSTLTTQEINTRAIQLYALYNGQTGTNNGCNTGTVCTTEMLVQNDVAMWRAELASALPGAPVTDIAVTAPLLGGASVVVINVTWTDRGDEYNYSVTSLL